MSHTNHPSLQNHSTSYNINANLYNTYYNYDKNNIAQLRYNNNVNNKFQTSSYTRPNNPNSYLQLNNFMMMTKQNNFNGSNYFNQNNFNNFEKSNPGILIQYQNKNNQSIYKNLFQSKGQYYPDQMRMSANMNNRNSLNNHLYNQINGNNNLMKNYNFDYINNINNINNISTIFPSRHDNFINYPNNSNISGNNIMYQRQQMIQNNHNINNLNPKTSIPYNMANYNLLYKAPKTFPYNNININQYNVMNNPTKIQLNIDNNFEEGIDINNKPIKLDSFVKARGLDNVGATCYMNATLQCIYHVKRLSETIINDNEIKEDKLPLTYCFKDLIEELTGCKDRERFHINRQLNIKDENAKNSYAPNKFKDIISEMNPLFKGITANDSKDLILFLLEKMDTELTKKNNRTDKMEQFIGTIEEMQPQNFLKFHNSIFFEVFYGFQKSIIICKNCNFTTNNYSIINFLVFPLEKVYNSLKQQGNNNFSNMNMNGFISNNQAYLRNSYNQSINSSLISNYLNPSTYILPQNGNTNLISTLRTEESKKVTLYDCFKEFIKGELLAGQNQIYCNNCNQSSDAQLTYEIIKPPNVFILIINRGRGNTFKCDLDFPQNFDLNKYLGINNNNKNIYDLIGVISHLGESSMEGHFIAYCKHFDEKWYIFNDSIVNKYDISKKFSGIPYILFYKRRLWN